MNIMRNKSMRSIVPFLLIAGSLFWFPLYSGGEVMNLENSILGINLNKVKNQADLILIGNLEIVTQPDEVIGKKRFYESGIQGEKFYKIKAVEILKGNLPAKCFLVVRANVLSSEGRHPSVEAQIPYLLFLQEVKSDEDAVRQDLVYYKLVGNWKGIISLDRTALECRSVNFIARQYGINIYERREDFKEAMRYSLKEQGTKVPKKDLNSGTFAVYEGLELIGELQQTTNQTVVEVPQIPGTGNTNDLGTAGNDGKP